VKKLAAFSVLLVTACKPPPTDADMNRDMPQAAPTFASAPLPSPETEGAMWARASNQSGGQNGPRLIYGIPGSPALIALECTGDEGELAALQITRLSPADEGAGALLALVGNGHIGRIEVAQTEVTGRPVWQGSAPAANIVWEPLAGPRQLTVTVPGAGMVTMNPSALPAQLIESCRTS
jgi:hypothetical protein